MDLRFVPLPVIESLVQTQFAFLAATGEGGPLRFAYDLSIGVAMFSSGVALNCEQHRHFARLADRPRGSNDPRSRGLA